MSHLEALTDYLLSPENHSPGFVAIRKSMIDYRNGLTIDWAEVVQIILADKELPIVEMLLVGVYEIWNTSLAFEIH